MPKLIMFLGFILLLVISGQLLLTTETSTVQAIWGILSGIGLIGGLIAVYLLWKKYIWLASSVGIMLIGLFFTFLSWGGYRSIVFMVSLQVFWLLLVFSKKLKALKGKDKSCVSILDKKLNTKCLFILRFARNTTGVVFLLFSGSAFYITVTNSQDIQFDVYFVPILLFAILMLVISVDILVLLPILQLLKNTLEENPRKRVLEFLFLGLIPFVSFVYLSFSIIYPFFKPDQALAVGFMLWFLISCIWGIKGYKLSMKVNGLSG